MGWQPIETAPKDGAVVVLLNDDGDIIAARFGTDGWWYDAGDGCWNDAFMTHWMPLPAPPAAQAQKGGE